MNDETTCYRIIFKDYLGRDTIILGRLIGIKDNVVVLESGKRKKYIINNKLVIKLTPTNKKFEYEVE